MPRRCAAWRSIEIGFARLVRLRPTKIYLRPWSLPRPNSRLLRTMHGGIYKGKIGKLYPMQRYEIGIILKEGKDEL